MNELKTTVQSEKIISCYLFARVGVTVTIAVGFKVQ